MDYLKIGFNIVMFGGSLLWFYIIWQQWKSHKKNVKTMNGLLEILDYFKEIKREYQKMEKPKLTLIKTEEKE